MWCPLEEINDLLLVWAAKAMISPVQCTIERFLNPYTTQFIVVFNNVGLAASRQFCPHCIYFLSDASPNNFVIPCGSTTQTAETPISLTSDPPASPLGAVTASFLSLLTPLYSPSPTAPLFFFFSTIFPSHCCTYFVHTLFSLLTRTSGKG